MGFSISWVGVGGLSRADVLRRAGLRDLETAAEAYDVGTCREPLSVAELPTGWTILVSNDFSYASADRLAALSAGASVIACQAEEHLMFSAAHCYAGSREAWSVCHDSQKGLHDLSTRGAPPAILEPIKTRLTAQQRRGEGFMLKSVSGTKNGKYILDLLKGFADRVRVSSAEEQWAPVDYLFDIPIELAAEATGYRHDRSEFEWGRPRFTKVGPIG